MQDFSVNRYQEGSIPWRRTVEKQTRSGPAQQVSHLKAMALTKVAKQAWNNDQRYKTIALLTEALRREPSNPEILVELATACGKQRHYKRAEELLGRLIEIAPRSPSMFRRVGFASRLLIVPNEPRNSSSFPGDEFASPQKESQRFWIWRICMSEAINWRSLNNW